MIVGVLVGLLVGFIDGLLVGFMVGFMVGLSVGLVVGLSVGSLVGLLVGFTVGFFVGSFVGESVAGTMGMGVASTSGGIGGSVPCVLRFFAKGAEYPEARPHNNIRKKVLCSDNRKQDEQFNGRIRLGCVRTNSEPFLVNAIVECSTFFEQYEKGEKQCLQSLDASNGLNLVQ